jgi:membrane associated rhomboid family serine protease
VYGSYVEKLIGWKTYSVVGAIAGVGGVLLSSCIMPYPHINGSSLPLGFLGFLFGYLIIKWE